MTQAAAWGPAHDKMFHGGLARRWSQLLLSQETFTRKLTWFWLVVVSSQLNGDIVWLFLRKFDTSWPGMAWHGLAWTRKLPRSIICLLLVCASVSCGASGSLGYILSNKKTSECVRPNIGKQIFLFILGNETFEQRHLQSQLPND